LTIDTNTKSLSFEQAIDELEKIVDEMERGDLPLQGALEKFERGVGLAKHGQAQLQAAEQKVQILSQQNGTQSLASLKSQGDNE
jgi:exodeoxyribonuclease VII small subunit